MDAERQSGSGLVSRIVPADKLNEEALAAAEKIAAMSRPAVAMAKEAINRAVRDAAVGGHGTSNRNLFHRRSPLDRSEAWRAFIEKRKPVNKNR